jgi:hypothetical protein
MVAVLGAVLLGQTWEYNVHMIRPGLFRQAPHYCQQVARSM